MFAVNSEMTPSRSNSPAARDDDLGLPLDSFTAVMATGIVSLAGALHGWRTVAQFLFAVNLLLFAGLGGVTLLRLLRNPRSFLVEFGDGQHGPGAFAVAVATCTIGLQCLTLAQWRTAGAVFWAFGAAFWCLLMYTVLPALIIRPMKPRAPLTGEWLLCVVATQAVAVLSVDTSKGAAWEPAATLLAVLLLLLGGLFYLVLHSWIWHDLLFDQVDARTLSPTSWIIMGATAITALAGTTLLQSRGPLVDGLRPFLIGMTLLFWVSGTWWIPVLIIFGVWRHVRHHVRIQYTGEYWGLVFPLGMYATATFALGQVLRLRIFEAISTIGDFHHICLRESGRVGRRVHRICGQPREICRPSAGQLNALA